MYGHETQKLKRKLRPLETMNKQKNKAEKKTNLEIKQKCKIQTVKKFNEERQHNKLYTCE